MAFHYVLLSGMVAAFLGDNGDGTYELPSIDPAELDVSHYVKLLENAQKQNPEIDVFELNWIDMQERVLSSMVKTAVDKLRVYALLNAPEHPMHLNQREFLASAEITQIGKETI